MFRYKNSSNFKRIVAILKTVAKKLGIKTVANKKRVANIAREILFRYKNSSKLKKQ